MAKEYSSCFILEKISELVGTSEPALKLLITVLAGYPLALIHRKYFYGKDVSLQHLFFIASGFSMGYWNYGRDMFHCVFTTFFTYCTLFILKGTDISVAITFIFNLGYLLIGYYYASTDSYDINWTMPQCILTLRLIGVAFDLYDGHQPVETLSKDSKKVALQRRPSLLEMFGHAFFPASFLVGPQFPMKRYQEFVSGQYSEKETPNQPPDSIDAAIRRFALGVLYLVIFQVLGMFVSDDLFLSEEFGNMGFARRILLLGIWGRYTLYKYISCWLLTEGACILFGFFLKMADNVENEFIRYICCLLYNVLAIVNDPLLIISILLGLTYNGEDENGEVQWNGLENIKISIFENTTEFGHFIQSFNVNTNQWSAQYIYKRLKFLGNRFVSQSVTLLFLAVWHGLHSGYYVCFLFEFIVMYMERDFKSIVKSNEMLTRFFDIPNLQLPLQIILRIYTFVFMGWCLLPFALLHFHSYMKAFANVNYIGAVLFLLWPIVYAPILKLIFKKTKIRTE